MLKTGPIGYHLDGCNAKTLFLDSTRRKSKMSYKDLRSFLETMEKEGQLLRVEWQ